MIQYNLFIHSPVDGHELFPVFGNRISFILFLGEGVNFLGQQDYSAEGLCKVTQLYTFGEGEGMESWAQKCHCILPPSKCFGNFHQCLELQVHSGAAVHFASGRMPLHFSFSENWGPSVPLV